MDGYSWVWVALYVALLVVIHLQYRYTYKIKVSHQKEVGLYEERLGLQFTEGVIVGQKLEMDWARKDAVEMYKLEQRRKLTDSGRRAVPREGAEAVRIHKAQIAPPRPQRPNNQD